MKLLHTSDLHLGKKIKNISLLEDQEEALSSILSIAKTNNIDAMILAGDIFDKCVEELKIGDGECTPDGKFSLDSCRCVGACGLAPVVIVGGDVYGKMTADKIPEVLAKYM
nr:NAD(P)H-dependent oxidoreductase subunit E [uncultured Mogibacterium sp.]